MKQLLLIAICLATVSLTVAQFPKNIIVKTDQHKADIKPTMWGIFFEDINFAADGGMYAELVKNRSFEFTTPLMGWKEQRKGVVGGSLWVLNRGISNQNNPRYIHVQNAVSGNYGITNEGFRGMGVVKDKQYDFSVLAKWPKGSDVKLRIELINAKGEIIGSAKLAAGTTEWKKYAVSFTASATEPKA
jgi:hypothetical protein